MLYLVLFFIRVLASQGLLLRRTVAGESSPRLHPPPPLPMFLNHSKYKLKTLEDNGSIRARCLPPSSILTSIVQSSDRAPFTFFAPLSLRDEHTVSTVHCSLLRSSLSPARRQVLPRWEISRHLAVSKRSQILPRWRSEAWLLAQPWQQRRASQPSWLLLKYRSKSSMLSKRNWYLLGFM